MLHIPAQTPSLLPSILDRITPLQVSQAINGERIEHGRVYVAPPDNHLLVERGFVRVLRGPKENRHRPAVDLLLSTAARSYGENLIAVILTGSGSDGAAGAVEVKQAGGVVIIQNPETAQYPSMPLSLPPTAVDHVIELEQIGPLVYDLIQGLQLPALEKVEAFCTLYAVSLTRPYEMLLTQCFVSGEA